MDVARRALRVTYISIAGNVVLALTKGIAGYFGNSYALIADAIESATDICASLIVLIGLLYASRPADKNHPYGHGRAEPLITFIVVGFLVASAILIVVQAIENIRTPHQLPRPYTLIVLAGVVIVKEIFYRAVNKRSAETNSSSLKADAWHHRSDAITSLMAFIGIGVALWMGPGYEMADDWAALVAAGFILYNSYLIFRPALGEIMDEQIDTALIDRVRLLSKQVQGVIDTEKCVIRKTGMSFHVDLHIIVDGSISVHEGHLIAHRVKDHLKGNFVNLADAHIHVEPA